MYIGKHYTTVRKKSVKTVQKSPKPWQNLRKISIIPEKVTKNDTFYFHTSEKKP